ncbi:hypothetical protein ACWODG_06695 [Enterococcus italicus]
MLEQILNAAGRTQEEFSELEENGWSKAEIEKYKRGFSNGFFDIVSELRFAGLLSDVEVSRIEAEFASKKGA